MWNEMDDKLIIKSIIEKKSPQDISKLLNISIRQLNVRIGQIACFFILKGSDMETLSTTMNLSPRQINHCIQTYSNPPCEENDELNYMYKIQMVKSSGGGDEDMFEECGFWCFTLNDCIDNLLRRLSMVSFKEEINEWLCGFDKCVCMAYIIRNDCEYSIVKRMIDVHYILETGDYDQKLNRYYFIDML
jgi:hypothetical protein